MGYVSPAIKGFLKYDIFNPNLDMFVDVLLAEMTPAQRIEIPPDLMIKAFKKGKPKASALRIGEKMYLLSVAFGIDTFIAVAGSKNGKDLASIESLKSALKASKGKKPVLEYAEELVAMCGFVLSSKQVMESLAFTSLVSVTDIYKQVIPAVRRVPREKQTQFEEHRKALKALVKMFGHYEANKKRIPMDFGFSTAEWYAMLFFFDGEKKGTAFYNETFRYALAASRTNLKKALTRLTLDGFLIARGATHRRVYSLSAKGDKYLLDIFQKLILNY